MHAEDWPHRDGDRIASRICGGYNDLVSDEQLETHANNPDLHPLDRAFASAVLALRNFERTAAAQL